VERYAERALRLQEALTRGLATARLFQNL
jgi:hypothetical protein